MINFVDSVPGQEKALKHLFQIYNSKRVPHAFLFSGPNGVGKHFAAINFFSLLNSSNDEEKDFSFRKKVDSLSEPYIKYIYPLPRGKGEGSDDMPFDKLSKQEIEAINVEIGKKIKNPYHALKIEKASNIKISSIREIKKFTSFNYDDVKWRLILISEAHLMNTESQNALLKSLEEPPPGIIFILMTSNPERLLTTIISRCWSIKFNSLSEEVIANILEEYFVIDYDQSKTVIPFVNGSLRKANELLSYEYKDMLDKVIQILRFSIAKRYNSAMKEFDDFNKNYSAKSFLELLKLVLNWLVDAQRNRGPNKKYYFNEYEEVFQKFNERFSHSDLLEIFSRIDKLIGLVDKNISLNIISLNAIFELSSLSKTQN